MVRLHVNVDHVATVRQARRARFPDPIAWALAAEEAGAHGITCHLRKDRRHVQDDDVRELRRKIKTLLNLETSLDPEMIDLAVVSGAEAICIVPENRQEVTTEGGLDVVSERRRLEKVMPLFEEKGAAVSLFVDPDREQLAAASEVGAPFIELHTGSYANATGEDRERERQRLEEAAIYAHQLSLRINAGHGLDLDNVGPIAALPYVEELNIGHSIVARALFVGVEGAVREMLERIGA